MSNALHISTSPDLTKSGIATSVAFLVEELKEQPIDALVKIKYLEEVLAALKEGVRDAAETHLLRAPKGEAKLHGATIKMTEGYDSPNLLEDAEYASLKERLDERAEKLKTAYKNKVKLVLEDGEIVPVVGTGKCVGATIRVTLGK